MWKEIWSQAVMNERDNLTNIAQVLEEIAHFSEAQTLPLNHDPVKKNTISHLHLSVLFFWYHHVALYFIILFQQVLSLDCSQVINQRLFR